jgi:glycosyltransferase involved in cell wall biosynthesis
MNKFSIVIPIYNEEENIIRLIEEIIQHTKDYSNFEIIIVNDGSTDQSLKRINSTFDQSLIKIINNKKNIGQSYSLKEGIIASNYQTIITLDGDGQNNPKDIPKLLEKYFSDDSIYLVGGIRNKRKDTFIKIVSSKIANNINPFFK